MTSLPGFSILIAVILELLKKFNLIPDGWGGKISVIANAILVAAFVIAGQLGLDLSTYDAGAKSVSDILVALLASGVLSWVTWKGMKETGLSAR